MKLELATKLSALTPSTLRKAFETNGYFDMQIKCIKDVDIRKDDVVYTVDMVDDGSFASPGDAKDIRVFVSENSKGEIVADV